MNATFFLLGRKIILTPFVCFLLLYKWAFRVT